jgi:NhaP-type Na+/H+ or K+/H+ antiporter
MQHTASLTIAVALAAGVVVQALAFHVRVPAIVLLLGTGFLLGPEFLDLVNPASLGGALLTLVGFAVAVILFEGGMNLNLARLRREQVVIRNLVTWGGLITALGGAAAALLFLRWDVTTSILFGTLVMVTGPTVVTPLLRRINVLPGLRTILEAEGVIIDAIGALVAVVTLEIVLHPTGRALASGLAGLPMRLGVGLALGLAGGALIALLLRVDRIVPERLANVFSLAMAMAIYQVSNSLLSESGLVAAIVAGLVVGNVRTRVLRELLEFKEQLTSMFIGMLFVLLSANLRWSDLRALGWGGAAVVASLMLVVRPAQVWLCARGTGLHWREKAFLSWLAPRGIVAAAVSSMFAQTLDAAGMPGGAGLRAMVFLVIVATVIVQGLPAGLVASLLRVRQAAGPAWVVVGANALGRIVARLLDEGGSRAVLIDIDPELCQAAEREGRRVVQGNAIEDRTLVAAGIDSARALVAVTANEGINLVCARKAIEDYRVRRAYVAVDRRPSGISADAVAEGGVRVLFGVPCDLRRWIGWGDRGLLKIERWQLTERRSTADPRGAAAADGAPPFLPLLVGRARRRFAVDERWSARRRDQLWVALIEERAAEARAWLQANGWQLHPSAAQAQSAAGADQAAAG